jgi:hypothetical protein
MQEDAWARSVWAGKSLAGHEVKRWLELSGYEVRDADAEDLNDSGGLCVEMGTGCERNEMNNGVERGE